MARQGLPSVHDLVPFDLALRLIFQRIYVERIHTAVASHGRLDGLANVVSSVVPLYLYTADREFVRLVEASELKGGLFADGGKSVHFLDGRPVLGNLAVASGAISTA